MDSLGRSFKWSSFDSLPSSTSFLHSESEQTEDEDDVFSGAEGENGNTQFFSHAEGVAHSRNCPLDQSLSRSSSDQTQRCPDKTTHPDSTSSPGAAASASSAPTPGDLVFAQKCANLHRFVHPLLELLHGLKTGRFDKGLSSFQKSVAIDRFHRILGILQRPHLGEKYLRNLLQIEVMLKMWFPQVPCESVETPSQTSTLRIPPHWHQDQLCMPVKKRKLSWSDHDHAGNIPTKIKQHHRGEDGSRQTATSLDIVPARLPGLLQKQEARADQPVGPATGNFPAGHAFTLSKPSYLCYGREDENRKYPEISPPSSCGGPAAQDSSVSSSDSIRWTDSLESTSADLAIACQSE